MDSSQAADVSMADPLTATPLFTQNAAKRRLLSSNNTKENELLHDYIVDLRKALDEAYKNVEVYRGQFLKAQQEKEKEKEEKEFLLKQLRRMQIQQQKTTKPDEPETTPNESSYDKTIIVTNVEESDDTTDNATITSLISKMDGAIKATSIKRLGRKDIGKKRKIAVEFNNKSERNAVLKKARDIITNDPQLGTANIFFNKSLPKDEQQIQYALRTESKAQKTQGMNVKIINNQICDVATSTPILCDANAKAKAFYDQRYSFRPRGYSIASSYYGCFGSAY
uniref:Uncharacterized protein n=1 Tax=Panagrolaimus davidi TaxID=227884 RepID=A0A914PC43_9BILA